MKMHPPLTEEGDRRALVEGLRDGTIDCVATDHAPHARDEKEVPFEQAPMGTTGLETAFAALHTGLVVPGELGLGLLVERMTAGAALFGLPARAARRRRARQRSRSPTSTPAGSPASTAGRAARRTAASPGARCRAASSLTLAAGAIAHRDRALAMVGA